MSRRLLVGVVAAIALAAPLIDILTHPDRITVLPSLQVDAAAYDAIAAALARRGSIAEIPPLQPPGFVLIIAGVYAVFGHSWVAARVLLWLLLVVTVVLTGRLAWRVYGRESAVLVAILLAATAPALHAYTGTIQYEIVAATAILAIVLVADWNVRAPADRAAVVRIAALALLLGAAALMREVLIVCIPLVALLIAWRRSFTAGAVVALVPALMIAGWAARQSARADRVVAVSDKGSLVLQFGNNPHANGTFNAGLAGVGEPSGFAFMRAEPGRTLVLAGRKVLYFWGLLRDGWNVPRRSAVWGARTTAALIPLEWWLPLARGGWILAALLVGLAVWSRPRWAQWWLLPATIAAVMAVHVLTVSSHRFAVPVLPLAFAIAAGPLAAAARWLFALPARLALAVLAAAVVFGMQAVAWPISYTVRAAATDGADAGLAEDDARGTIRVADAAPGPRVVLLLGDQFLPRGRFTVTLGIRSAPAPRDQVIARLRARSADGVPLCEADVLGAPTARGWIDVAMPCAIGSDAIVSVLVETTGTVELAFDRVTLQW